MEENKFTEFVNFCEKYLIKTPDLVKLMRKRYSECNKSYKQSHEFLDCVEITRAKIESDDVRIFVHLRDFLKELKKHKVNDSESHGRKRKRHPSDLPSDGYDSSERSPKSVKTDSTDASDSENTTPCGALRLNNSATQDPQYKGTGVSVNQENGEEFIVENVEVKVHSQDQSKSKDSGHVTPLVSPSKNFEVLEISTDTTDSDCVVLGSIDTHKQLKSDETEPSEKNGNQRFKFTKHKVDNLIKHLGLKRIIERKNSTSSNSSVDRGCSSVSSESEDDVISSYDPSTDDKSLQKISLAQEMLSSSSSSSSTCTSTSDLKVSEPQEKRLKLHQNTQNGSITQKQKILNEGDKEHDSSTEKSHDLSCDLFDSSVDDVAKMDAEETISASDGSSGDSADGNSIKKPNHSKAADGVSNVETDDVEPSTSIAAEPSKSTAEDSSKSATDGPSTSTTVELSNSTAEDPSKSATDGLLASTTEGLSASTVEKSTLATEGPPTSLAEEPSISTTEKLSTSTAEELSTSTAEKPSTPKTEEPSTSTSEKPSISTAVETSISTAEKLSTSTTEKLSSSTAENPSISTAVETSTATAEKLSTSTSEGPSTSTAEGPSTSTAEGPSTSTAEGPSTSTAERPSTSTAEGPSTSTVEEETPVQKKGSKRQIQRLEKLLEDIRNKIEELKSAELSLDDMEAEDSNYILEDKYQKKFVKVWNKLCELKGSLTTTGRPVEKRFSYTGTRYPEINRKIEKFINRKKVFPDYHDVWEIINKVNKVTKMGLRGPAVDRLAREAFTDVGDILQKRRRHDLMYTSQGFLPTEFRKEDDPALKDSELKKKLDENRKLSKDRLEEVVEKFCKKQENYKEEDEDDDDDEEDEVSGENKSAQNSDSEEENIEVPEMDKIIAETDNFQPQTNKLQYDSSTINISSRHQMGPSRSAEYFNKINLIKIDDSLDVTDDETWNKTSSPSKKSLSNTSHTSNDSEGEMTISAREITVDNSSAGEITIDNSSDEEILISDDIVIDIAENSLNDEESNSKGEASTGIEKMEEDKFNDIKEVSASKKQQKDEIMISEDTVIDITENSLNDEESDSKGEASTGIEKTEENKFNDIMEVSASKSQQKDGDKMSASKHTSECLDKENEQVESSFNSKLDEKIILKLDESSESENDLLLEDSDTTKDHLKEKENKDCLDSNVQGSPVRESNSEPNSPIAVSDPADDVSGLDSSCVVIEDEDSSRSDEEQIASIKIENVRSFNTMDDIDRMFNNSDDSDCDSKVKLPEINSSSSDNEAARSDAEKNTSSSSGQQTPCKQNHSPGVSTSVSSSHSTSSSTQNVFIKKTPLSSWQTSSPKSSGNKIRVDNSGASNINQTTNATSISRDDGTVIAIDDSDDDIDDISDNESTRLSAEDTDDQFIIVKNKSPVSSPGSRSHTVDHNDSNGEDSNDCVILLDSD